MKHVIVTTVCLLSLCGCTPNAKTPDNIRQDAADATASAARGAAIATQDAKAAVQGVQDGLRNLAPLNLNTASEQDLASLPGMTDAAAGRMIVGRPYKSTDELVSRHILTRAEYDRISSRIKAE
ncbi:ComEA family DNA-binding protein [Granulicella sibirica]|uniref:ComEA family DNA-binding protein n=1 Tax=Granulicella sibirica TaxID=2479048 RepID=UPI0010089275|nr:helix-hairpin-helix domain-containing protein [Granulicella sibirica]